MFGAISEKFRTFDMQINFAISPPPGRPKSAFSEVVESGVL